MGQFYPLIEVVILLSAPRATIMARLEARTTDGYGQTEDERRKVAALVATVEPLLRDAADCEIDTSGSLDAVVDEVVRACSRRMAPVSFG